MLQLLRRIHAQYLAPPVDAPLHALQESRIARLPLAGLGGLRWLFCDELTVVSFTLFYLALDLAGDGFRIFTTALPRLPIFPLQSVDLGKLLRLRFVEVQQRGFKPPCL